jgi:hypothetical protein
LRHLPPPQRTQHVLILRCARRPVPRLHLLPRQGRGIF